MNKEQTILVTGGAGFIGSHTIVDLLDRGFSKVISVDNYSNSTEKTYERIERITGVAVKYYDVDLTDLSKTKRIFQENKIDAIIHFAAYKAVGESVEKPLKYYRNNIPSVINLLVCCDEFTVNDFIFSSSCTVYGNPDNIPVTEETPIKPAISPYGNTKRIAEEMITDFASTHPEFKSIMLRYFNPAGAHKSGKLGELPLGVPNNLMPYITQTAKGIREELTVFGDDFPTRDGSCVRDYIHVMDIARAHTLAYEKILKGEGNQDQIQFYNLGSGEGVTVLEIIKAFEKVNGLKLNYKIGPRRMGNVDIPAIYSDSTLAEKELGWKVNYNLEDMVGSAWNWEKELSNEN